MWNKLVLSLVAIMLIGWMSVPARAQVPPRPDPPRLVNDFAKILGECQWLEDSLEAIAIETTNQICVVTMDDFGGLDRAIMAQKIGQDWGVGTKENRNGVVILIKPKTEESKGEAFIATGYGLEGAITDATCALIVNREMIPHFKKNDYLTGVWEGAKVVRNLAIGEYSQDEYKKEGNGTRWWTWLTTIGLILLYFIFRRDILSFFRGSNDSDSNESSESSGIIDDDDGDIDDDDDDDDDDDYSSGTWGASDSDDSSWHGFSGGSFGGSGGGGSW